MHKLYTFGRMKQLFNAIAEDIKANSFVDGFSIDSRSLNKGDLFFCIKGEKTDGHFYIAEAIDRGASGIVANPKFIPDNLLKQKFPRIFVSDPNLAFSEWASDYRKQFKGKVIAITGSNGKTTTKDIITNLCRFFDPITSSTPGNYNNKIGVPITILNADLEAKWWIVEIGTNQFGEISHLSEIVKPTAGIITNIGESHLEFLKTTEGVAHEKSGLFDGMTCGNNVVIPDSIMHKEIIKNKARNLGLKVTKTKKISVELSSGKTKFRLLDKDFETSIKSPLLLQNLVLALTILNLEGVPVSDLVSATSVLEFTVKGRFNQIILENWILIDDTYNANPSSFNSVLENLNRMYPDRRKIVVCGAMAELGILSNNCHLQVGGNMVKNGISYLFGLGESEIYSYIKGWINEGGNKKAAKQFVALKELVASFKEVLKKDDVVLVKGSRSSRMEEFVEAILSKNY